MHATKPRGPVRRWIRRIFVAWAIFSTGWMVNSMRTRGVDPVLLRSDGLVTVVDTTESLELRPAAPRNAGLIFICGSGVAAAAYVPLLRPIAQAGHPVRIVKLPWRFAFLESHKQAAIARVRAAAATPAATRWVVSGHSLGGALAARVAADNPPVASALALIGTTHPKEQDLSGLSLPVLKIYGTADGVAPAHRVLENARLLPKSTRWVAIEGGNHSQFGHYGHQLMDGDATISREAQQQLARAALLELLKSLDGGTDGTRE